MFNKGFKFKCFKNAKNVQDNNCVTHDRGAIVFILHKFYPQGTIFGSILGFLPSLIAFIISRLQKHQDFLVLMPNIQRN